MKKKILLPIIIAVVAVALIAIAAITIYTGKYGKNAPILEVKEEVTVMEYSTVHIDEFIINTENISSVRIADIKLQGRNDPGHAKISDDGQSVSIGDFWEFYTVTIEAKGTNGWKVREEVGLYSYEEPPVYVSEESSDEVLEDEINTEAVSEERVSEEASETEANKDGASEELENSEYASEEAQNLEGLSEEERFLAELEKIEGDYTYEEADKMSWDELMYVDKCYGTWDHLYFKDAESFLTAYGFDMDEPFYEVYADGKLQLTLYYDEETQLGCCVRGGYGACFLGVTEAEWNGYLWGDYMDPVIVYDGHRPEDYMGDYHYDEIKEYDNAGRLVEYRVTNIEDLMEEKVSGAKDFYSMWNDALKVTYEYQPNGKLAYRYYIHNSYMFGTNTSSLETWFDEQGRPVYERAYITHGSLEWFYIYQDEDEIPEFILSTDFGWNPAEFTKYE